MSYILIDKSENNFEFNASVWNWKTVVEIIRSFDLLNSGIVRELSMNPSGVSISKEDAKTIGERIRAEILPKLEPNKRIYSNLTITDEIDDGVFHKDEDMQWKNYSAKYDWLSDFSDFCLQSSGFQIY